MVAVPTAFLGVTRGFYYNWEKQPIRIRVNPDFLDAFLRF